MKKSMGGRRRKSHRRHHRKSMRGGTFDIGHKSSGGTFVKQM